MSLRTLRYTWSFWPWCRHRHMSPYNVVSSCLAVSPLPFRRFIFCYGIHKITPICDFHSRVPFPVRTFLCLEFLVVISSSLLFPHILTTDRLLRYSSFAFLEIPHHKYQTATEAFYLIPVATAGAVFSGGTFSSVPEPATEAFYLVSATCYTFAVKT